MIIHNVSDQDLKLVFSGDMFLEIKSGQSKEVPDKMIMEKAKQDLDELVREGILILEQEKEL